MGKGFKFPRGSYPHGHAHCPDKALVIVLRLLDGPASTEVRRERE